jgi:deazaflavin-dependent oxidoreductase (nitroreductase family)
MTSEPTIIDSPSDWVADHIRLYVETNGEEGHIWRGVPTLLLTVTGRKSGALRRTALIYGRIGNDYVIVASKGGHPTNPLWYENLLANKEVTLQAQTMGEDADRESAWNTMVGIWPDFANYQLKTERRIPLVRLTRIS